MTILHLATAADWEAARGTGTYEVSSRGLTLAQQGYVHCSTAEQLPGVVATHYADVTEPLVLLELEESLLEAAGSPVKWEPVPGAAQPFPHVYGPILPTCVVSVSPFRHPGH